MAGINLRSRAKSKSAGRRTARNGVVTKGVGFKRYMESLGWRWTPLMSIGSGCRHKLNAYDLPVCLGSLVVVVSRHLVAVVDGVIHDTHDCSRGGTRCVYGYYWNPHTKETSVQ